MFISKNAQYIEAPPSFRATIVHPIKFLFKPNEIEILKRKYFLSKTQPIFEKFSCGKRKVHFVIHN